MKKKLLLLAGLLLVSSLASAKVVVDDDTYSLNNEDEVLTYILEACVEAEPLGAWWNLGGEGSFTGEGFDPSERTLTRDIGTMNMGGYLPEIADEEIYVVAALSGPYDMDVQAAITVGPMMLEHISDASVFATIPVYVRDNSHPSREWDTTITISPNSAFGYGDGLAVRAAEAAMGLDEDDLAPYLGGEIVGFRVDTGYTPGDDYAAGLTHDKILAPLKPGCYTGEAEITVSIDF